MTASIQKISFGYKQTEIGMIPKDWNVKELREVADFTNGKAHENFISDHGDYVVVNSKFISSEGEVAKYSNENFVPAKKNSILMVMSDVPNGKAIAKCFLVDRNDTYTVNQRICSLRAKVDPQFLFYKLDRNPFYLSFDDGVKQTNLRKDDVLDCKLSIPNDKQEQSAIAEAISNANSLIKKLEKLIEKKKNIKQGVMQELLTGKRRLQGFNGNWKDKKIADVCGKITTGKLNANAMVEGGEYRFYTCAKDFYQIDHYAFDTEALLVSGNGANVGYIHHYKGKFNAYQRTYVLSDFSADVQYVKLFLDRNLQERIRVEVNAGNTPYITMGTLTEMEIRIPADKEEQTAIAKVLSDMDLEIEKLESQLSKYQNIKQGMMQTLLTGKIRLINN